MNRPIKSKNVKRNGCRQGFFLLTAGGIVATLAAIVSLPLLSIKEPDHGTALRKHLALNYKLCAFYLARDGKAPFVHELELEMNDSLWKLVDLETGSQLDLNNGCNKTKVLGKLLPRFGKLAYGLDLGNGNKSCVTRSGEEREDWSCK